MPWSSLPLWSRVRSRFRDYDSVQSLAVVLIYVQICCALVGSLGALFNGVLLINLVVALFALVAIESSSQNLGRTYAVLLASCLVIEIVWFILFSSTIWSYSPEKYGSFFVFSLRLAFWMQAIVFSVKVLSGILWIQIYRLGASSVNSTAYGEADFDMRNSFLNPANHDIARQNSNSDDALGGSIYDPAYYSSLFESPHGSGFQGDRRTTGPDGGSMSANEVSQHNSFIGRSSQADRLHWKSPRAEDLVR